VDKENQLSGHQNRERMDIVLDGEETNLKIKNPAPPKKIKVDRTWSVLGNVSQIGFAIAMPIAVGAIAGKFLDAKFGIYPKMTLSLLMTGIMISVLGFVKTIQEIIKKLKD
jgi:hypothetical protein